MFRNGLAAGLAESFPRSAALYLTVPHGIRLAHTFVS
jgi:hypothetical protein